MKRRLVLGYGKLSICVFAASWLPIQAQTPEINPQGLVNLATGNSSSSVPVVARGSLVAIYGKNLASATLAGNPAAFATELGGTHVLFGDIPAPLLYVSPDQITAQVPFELPDVSSVDLTVRNGSGNSAGLKVTLLAQDPAIFVALKSGAPVSPSNPVLAGDSITIYATGLGEVLPPVPSGQPAPSSPIPIVAIPPVVKLGGRAVHVDFAGLAPGLVIYQINATAPTDLAGPTSDISVEPGVIPAVTGPPGPIGPRGAAGEAGPPGPRGATGAAGANGANGVNGATGPQGPQGLRGVTGAAGPAGPRGVSWQGTWNNSTAYALQDAVQYAGASYIGIQPGTGQQPDTSPAFWSVLAQVGTPGPAGTAGPAGPAGATGPAGANGANGAIGSPGPQGATGAAGPRGVSWQGTWNNSTAYALYDAVQYSGTSYISIQAGAAQQPDTSPAFWSVLAQEGATGPAGAAGPAGPTGAAGASGAIGPPGPQGATGAAGPAAIRLVAGIASIAPGAANNFAAVIGNNIATANEGNFQMPVEFNCTVQSVRVHFQTAPSATVNVAKFFDITLRRNGANTGSSCRIESTATDCTMSVNTAVTSLTDLLAWSLVGNQTGAAPANPGVASITGVCQ